ncbi:MAG: pseudouridine synthase [Lachnospiraceae bacterium]|nr:pseudouridine synthase [Lachnospiraceae bacterium]
MNAENEGKRLNKYIADAGFCSRREADRKIADGKVKIRRKSRKDEPEHEPVRASLGDRVFPGDTVIVEGVELQKKEKKKVYYLLNKPVGIVCTGDPDVENNVIDYLGARERVNYAGRLDKDSSGLLLLTNDGAMIDAMMRASSHREKEYIVTVNKEITDDFVDKMRSGVKILLDDDAHLSGDHPRGIYVTTRPCHVKRIGEKKFSIILTEGHNRQIRRMCRALGYHVTSLTRVRLMNLTLGDLKEGRSRRLTYEEVETLRSELS